MTRKACGTRGAGVERASAPGGGSALRPRSLRTRGACLGSTVGLLYTQGLLTDANTAREEHWNGIRR
jgi:hypothetical protein